MRTRELVIESPKHGRHIVQYDASDADKIEPYTWSLMRGHSTYYAKRNLPRRADGSRPTPILLHRDLAGCPKGMMADHINGNGLDNRQENIRICTMSQNMMNRGKTRDNSTGYKGVYKAGDSKLNPYSAKIQKDGKVYCLGHYGTAEEAARAYDKKAIELFEEFAVLNFPEDKA